MKENIYLFFLVFFLTVISYDSFSQKWQWGNKIGLDPGGNDYGMAMAKDESGNILVTGRVKGNSTFGTGGGAVTLITYGDRDIYICKYDSLGDFIWARRYGGLYSDYGLGIATDTNSNIYITGYYTDSAQFESNNIIGNGGQDIFIAKINELGSLVWVRSIGGTSNEYANALAVDQEGNSYITGVFNGSVVFGSSTLTSSGSIDFFISKFDTYGNCIWGKRAGNSLNDEGKSIVVNESGTEVYVCGYYNNNVTFGTIALNGFGGNDIFIAKYDTSGTCTWAQRAGSSSHEFASALALDKMGNVFVTGNYIAPVNFGTTATPLIIATSSGSQDVFIAKYDVVGNIIWAKKALGGTGIDNSQGITINKFDNPVFCGFFETTCSFDGVLRTIEGDSRDVFVTEYDSIGNIIWLKTYKGIMKSGIMASGHAVITDNTEHTYLTGGFLDTVSFDGITMVAVGISSDVFTGKLSPFIEASFSASQTTVCKGDSINFIDNSRGMPMTYEWLFSGGIPQNSTVFNPAVFYDSIGTFDVQLIVNNGIEADTLFLNNFITVLPCSVSINDIASDIEVSVFPNPASFPPSLSINNVADYKGLSFRLYDMLGKSVLSIYEIKNKKTLLDTGHLAKGIYSYVINSEEGILKRGKIVIN